MVYASMDSCENSNLQDTAEAEEPQQTQLPRAIFQHGSVAKSIQNSLVEFQHYRLSALQTPNFIG